MLSLPPPLTLTLTCLFSGASFSGCLLLLSFCLCGMSGNEGWWVGAWWVRGWGGVVGVGVVMGMGMGRGGGFGWVGGWGGDCLGSLHYLSVDARRISSRFGAHE